jgi:hypothetical protein
MGSYSYGAGNGFTPNISVDYIAMAFWDNDFGDMVNVAYVHPGLYNPSDPPRYCEIIFTPDPGYSVALNSFDIARWYYNIFPTAFESWSIKILDANSNILLDYGNDIFIPTGDTHDVYTPMLTYNGLIRIQMGYAGTEFDGPIDTGIDNINFDQIGPSAAPVPEPATIFLMSTGLLGLIGASRKKLKRK